MGIAIQNIETELIKEWGFVESGAFEIPEGYREISVDGPPLPEQMEPPPLSIAQQMDAVYRSLPAAVQAAFLLHKAAINNELQSPSPNFDVIRLLIAGVTIDPSLESSRTLLLSVLPE